MKILKTFIPVIAVLCITVLYSCEKKEVPNVTTSETSNISFNTATSGGTINDEGSGTVTVRGICWSKNLNPTTADDRTIEGGGAGSFISNLTQLDHGTTYYVKAYATNSAGTGYGMAMSFKTGTYQTVSIGTQVWMSNNLNTTTFNDGTVIPLVTDNTIWSNTSTPAFCWYNNDETIYKEKYGALYNWYAINTGKLCPTGFHVPSATEWTTLINFLGGDVVSGGKLKHNGFQYWLSPNQDATNETGFSAVGTGFRFYLDGSFIKLYIDSYFWSSTEATSTTAYRVGLTYSLGRALYTTSTKPHGFSVRCIKD